MSYPINYPTPQGANVQIFQEGGSVSDWVKPQGASFVWFTLIGAGSGGDGAGSQGGGSGAVTNFMGPAFLMPDQLKISVAAGVFAGSAAGATTVSYQQKDGTGYTLLTANGGRSGGTGALASASNNFSCMGFYQSVAGATGGNANPLTPSATTFLAGGNTGQNYVMNSNYGYTNPTGAPNNNGYLLMQPIIVGMGAKSSGKGGTGCGGGTTGTGGDGMVVIITW